MRNGLLTPAPGLAQTPVVHKHSEKNTQNETRPANLVRVGHSVIAGTALRNQTLLEYAKDGQRRELFVAKQR